MTGKPLSASVLHSDQGSTNRMTIIVRGNKFEVYANGDRLGVFTDSTLTQGIVAFMAWQESGKTTCTFTNAWLWVLKGGK